MSLHCSPTSEIEFVALILGDRSQPFKLCDVLILSAISCRLQYSRTSVLYDKSRDMAMPNDPDPNTPITANLT